MKRKFILYIFLSLSFYVHGQDIKYWQDLASKGDLDAIYHLAICYQKGLGTNVNIEKSISYYRIAAEKKHPQALYFIGDCYDKGKYGFPFGKRKAALLFKIGADNGDDMCALGYFRFCRNISNKRDDCLKYLKIAAEKGNAHALFVLGMAYYEHDFVQEDLVESKRLLELAAKKGDPEAEKYIPVVEKALIEKMYLDYTAQKAAIQKENSESTYNKKNNFIEEKINQNGYAIIIANENYENAPKVPYAINDGEDIYNCINTVLGVPAENIKFIKDATFNDIIIALKWVEEILSIKKNNDSKVIIYYAGHGMSSTIEDNAFILPVDANGAIPETGLEINRLYNKLANQNDVKTILFLDACFSGKSRNGEVANTDTRGVAIRTPKLYMEKNVLIFSATTKEDVASSYDEKKHGLFTYYLLEELIEKKGEITLGELCKNVIVKVRQNSIRLHNSLQSPTVVSMNNFEMWKQWKLK